MDGLPTAKDFRRGLVGIVLVIAPAVVLGTYLPSWVQSYHLTGEGLWNLKKKGAPDELIEPLHPLRVQAFFFKNSLMNEVERRVPNELFEQYRRKIEKQIKPIPLPMVEAYFLAALALVYLGVWWILRPYEAKGWI